MFRHRRDGSDHISNGAAHRRCRRNRHRHLFARRPCHRHGRLPRKWCFPRRYEPVVNGGRCLQARSRRDRHDHVVRRKGHSRQAAFGRHRGAEGVGGVGCAGLSHRRPHGRFDLPTLVLSVRGLYPGWDRRRRSVPHVLSADAQDTRKERDMDHGHDERKGPIDGRAGNDASSHAGR